MTRFLATDKVFFHGTYSNFSRFKPLSHFGSIYAAKEMASNGLKKEENRSGYVAVSRTRTGDPSYIIPVKLNLKNTYELQDVNAIHNIGYYREVLLYHFIKELKRSKVSSAYDYIVCEPFAKGTISSVRKELETDNLYEVAKDSSYSEEFDRKHLFFQRMIHYFESIGFDGFHYTNYYEDTGHVSYVPFRSDSIIRLDKPYEIRARANIDNQMKFDGQRFLSENEEYLLRNEMVNRLESMADKIELFAEHRNVLLRPSDFRQILREKLYYSKLLFSEILPKIERVTKQPKYGYHGMGHTAQVGIMGLDFALSVRQDPLPVILAASLRDCASVKDECCEAHGANCEPIARKFLADNYPNLLPVEIEEIINAVKTHTVGRACTDLVSACLWDADRVRLSWELGYSPEPFSTPYGNVVAGLDEPGRAKYIAGQEKFLVQNNIKTRAQIEYDKVMESRQTALDTVFKCKGK